jgi:antitoxin component of RelBE/YafQ-DinJ toxin-antitoxin module
MLDDGLLSSVLSQLDGIANAPMTAHQREMRAQGLLAEAGVTVSDIVKAMLTYRLAWNQRKAQECGVPVDTWLQAARIVKQSPGESLGDLLQRIHQMEAVVNMLRAGYIPGRDAHGRLVWSH